MRAAPRCSGRCRSAATATATAIVSVSVSGSASASARAGSSFSSGVRRTGFSDTGAPFGLGFLVLRKGEGGKWK